MSNDLIQTFAIYVLPILFAITLHEACHAYAAKYFGDSTAYLQGRMSLNPVKHIDPVGTILIPLVLFVAGSPFLFGYAKPVPIDFGKLRQPKRDMAWVALAGPGANLAMAIIWKLAEVSLRGAHFSEESFFLRMAEAGVLTNLVIFSFNLFPVPPLDGGRVLTSWLPGKQAYKFAQIEPYGFFIVLALAYLNLLGFWLMPMMTVAGALVNIVVYPLTFFLN